MAELLYQDSEPHIFAQPFVHVKVTFTNVILLPHVASLLVGSITLELRLVLVAFSACFCVLGTFPPIETIVRSILQFQFRQRLLLVGLALCRSIHRKNVRSFLFSSKSNSATLSATFLAAERGRELPFSIDVTLEERAILFCFSSPSWIRLCHTSETIIGGRVSLVLGRMYQSWLGMHRPTVSARLALEKSAMAIEIVLQSAHVGLARGLPLCFKRGIAAVLTACRAHG